MSRPASKPRHGHLAPFLWSLVERSGLPHKVIAADVGISETRLSSRLYRPEPMVLGKVLAVAARCGATPAELDRVRILDALDRGALPLPEGVTEEDVAIMLGVLKMRQDIRNGTLGVEVEVPLPTKVPPKRVWR